MGGSRYARCPFCPLCSIAADRVSYPQVIPRCGQPVDIGHGLSTDGDNLWITVPVLDFRFVPYVRIE